MLGDLPSARSPTTQYPAERVGRLALAGFHLLNNGQKRVKMIDNSTYYEEFSTRFQRPSR